MHEVGKVVLSRAAWGAGPRGVTKHSELEVDGVKRQGQNACPLCEAGVCFYSRGRGTPQGLVRGKSYPVCLLERPRQPQSEGQRGAFCTSRETPWPARGRKFMPKADRHSPGDRLAYT